MSTVDKQDVTLTLKNLPRVVRALRKASSTKSVALVAKGIQITMYYFGSRAEETWSFVWHFGTKIELLGYEKV